MNNQKLKISLPYMSKLYHIYKRNRTHIIFFGNVTIIAYQFQATDYVLLKIVVRATRRRPLTTTRSFVAAALTTNLTIQLVQTNTI